MPVQGIAFAVTGRVDQNHLMAACEMIDLSPPHLSRHQKAGPANHGRTVADDVNIDFAQQGGNALLAEDSNALVFGRLHDKLHFQGDRLSYGDLRSSLVVHAP
jgi:hypothetical protein